MSSRFRIYYADDCETQSEDLVAAELSQAVNRAESRCAASRKVGYFEIWQDANLLFTSEDRPGAAEPAATSNVRWQ